MKWVIGMQPIGEQPPVSADEADLERTAVEQIRSDAGLRADAARTLFFLYFARIERAIQHRLRLRGLSYDPASEHYGPVFDFVHRRVFAPEAIEPAIADFDPTAGPLAGWLLRRVDFAVRDWLKSVRFDRASVNGVDPVQLDGAFGEGRARDDRAEQGRFLEGAFEQLSPAQRACSVLRILPARRPTSADCRILVDVSGRSPGELERLLRDLADSVSGDSAGIREQELLAEVADWMAWQRCQRQLYGHLRKTLCIESSAAECELAELELTARDQTAGTIRRKMQALRKSPPDEHRGALLRAQFQLCCHELHRSERRLAELRREYAAIRPTAILSYEQIAAVLDKSVASVTTHLHEARVRIENSLNQVKPEH